MWPLFKRDGLGLEYLVLTLFWNFLIGYNPFSLRTSFVKYLSLVSCIHLDSPTLADDVDYQISYSAIVILHTLELVASPPAHLPDLFVVFNLTLSAVVFSLGFLWGTKRSLQEGWAVVGIQSLGPDTGSAKGSSHHGRKAGSERNGNLRPVERRTVNSSAGDPGYPSTRVRQDLPRQRLASTSGRSNGRL